MKLRNPIKVLAGHLKDRDDLKFVARPEAMCEIERDQYDRTKARVVDDQSYLVRCAVAVVLLAGGGGVLVVDYFGRSSWTPEGITSEELAKLPQAVQSLYLPPISLSLSEAKRYYALQEGEGDIELNDKALNLVYIKWVANAYQQYVRAENDPSTDTERVRVELVDFIRAYGKLRLYKKYEGQDGLEKIDGIENEKDFVLADLEAENHPDIPQAAWAKNVGVPFYHHKSNILYFPAFDPNADMNTQFLFYWLALSDAYRAKGFDESRFHGDALENLTRRLPPLEHSSTQMQFDNSLGIFVKGLRSDPREPVLARALINNFQALCDPFFEGREAAFGQRLIYLAVKILLQKYSAQIAPSYKEVLLEIAGNPNLIVANWLEIVNRVYDIPSAEEGSVVMEESSRGEALAAAQLGVALNYVEKLFHYMHYSKDELNRLARGKRDNPVNSILYEDFDMFAQLLNKNGNQSDGVKQMREFLATHGRLLLFSLGMDESSAKLRKGVEGEAFFNIDSLKYLTCRPGTDNLADIEWFRENQVPFYYGDDNTVYLADTHAAETYNLLQEHFFVFGIIERVAFSGPARKWLNEYFVAKGETLAIANAVDALGQFIEAGDKIADMDRIKDVASLIAVIGKLVDQYKLAELDPPRKSGKGEKNTLSAAEHLSTQKKARNAAVYLIVSRSLFLRDERFKPVMTFLEEILKHPSKIK